jgi:hypothetical protein
MLRSWRGARKAAGTVASSTVNFTSTTAALRAAHFTQSYRRPPAHSAKAELPQPGAPRGMATGRVAVMLDDTQRKHFLQ